MAKLNLHELSELMREIDFVMLQTRTEGCKIAGRPMSNNRDVEFAVAVDGTRTRKRR